MKEIKILTPIGMLGYGFPEADYLHGIEKEPDAVILDAGSTDPGPYQLGLGQTISKPEAYIRDLTLILRGIGSKNIPLLISSAGGAGSDVHVEIMINLIKTVCAKLGLNKKMVVVYADIDPKVVGERLAQGRITSCASSPDLTQQDIDGAVRIVAQMGAEPILAAMQQYPDADIYLAGRAYDPSPYAAFCMYHGIKDPGIYWHMGKIMECGAACADPKGAVILATVREDSFDLEPLAENERCTTVSVAAHTLYEKTRPDLLPGPGGVLDLNKAHYEQITDRAVRVSGSVFKPSPVYQIKLEGASIIGYRCIAIAGIRDPILISMIDKFLVMIRAYVSERYADLKSGDAKMYFHLYGKNAVMGEQEPQKDFVPLEIGVLCEVTAKTQEMANAICSMSRIALLHGPYPDQLATAGNIALPLNPPDNPIGPVCKFSIYHLMEVNSPTEFFPIKYMEI
jgi:hypothetical protein